MHCLVFDIVDFLCECILDRAVKHMRSHKKFKEYADVAELVDALVLGTSIERCGGSSPFIRTKVIFPHGAAVAQLTVNQLVGGSNPSVGAKIRVAKYQQYVGRNLGTISPSREGYI